MLPEQVFIGSCLLEPTLIDKAVQQGLKSDFFTSVERQALWRAILPLHTGGKEVDANALQMEMGKACPFAEIFACEKSAPTHALGAKALKKIVEAHNISQIRPALNDILSKIDDGVAYKDIEASLESIPSMLQSSESQEHTMKEISKDATTWAMEQISGKIDMSKQVVTGLPRFDHAITPIQSHEYVVVGARTSTGKTSFMTQMAGVNVNRGLKVAYFTIETSARSIVLQMAAQRAEVNLRDLGSEFENKQGAFCKEIERIGRQDLLIFEKDLSLEAIEARCRLLAASFKPNLVLIDYMGLISIKGEGSYERMSKLSKAMIPLRKTLGCALVVAAQLNRGNEKDDRPPSRTDFRDTGSIEEDAHRILCLHRPSKDDGGMDQGYDRAEYQQEIYQLKLRDGPLCQGRVMFVAKHTLFKERQ
jgi:replicative DNA helicase